MEKNKRQVPRLRFPGFNDAWEQRKLGEVAERVTRKNTEMISKLPLQFLHSIDLLHKQNFLISKLQVKILVDIT